jgi:hypothetical protein
VRPSDSSTFILPVAKLTPTGLTKKLVPGCFELLTVRLDQFTDIIQLARAEAVIIRLRQAGA